VRRIGELFVIMGHRILLQVCMCTTVLHARAAIDRVVQIYALNQVKS